MRRAFGTAAMWLLLVAWNPSTTAAAANVGIAVRGPADWHEAETYRLEVGDLLWLITPSDGGSVTDITVTRSGVARFVRTSDCQELVRISIAPGTRWVIRAAGDGTFTVEDRTEQGLDLGPAMSSVPFVPCMPDTAADSTTRSRDDDTVLPALVLAALAGLAFSAHRSSRRAVAKLP